ncbi:MAG: IclR family transcriptional regulator, partial [Alphaproteobacteria bacterium]
MHLDRLISVLETVAAAGRPVSAADVQRATDLPRPTCYRLLQTLAEHRLLDVTDGPALYSIGKRVQRLAVLGRSDADVATTVAPVLKETAIALGEAVFLSRFRDQRVEIVHVETPDDATRSFIHPGLGKRPLHACSCSKVIAAFADTDFQQSILEGPRRAYTEQTKTDAALIELDAATMTAPDGTAPDLPSLDA